MAGKPAQQKYITRKQLQERWNCSHMFIERLIKNCSDFPPYSQLGSGPLAQRRWNLDAIEAFERSRVVYERDALNRKQSSS
jgi:hypothetical protein